jgi:hypothetical protein
MPSASPSSGPPCGTAQARSSLLCRRSVTRARVGGRCPPIEIRRIVWRRCLRFRWKSFECFEAVVPPPKDRDSRNIVTGIHQHECQQNASFSVAFAPAFHKAPARSGKRSWWPRLWLDVDSDGRPLSVNCGACGWLLLLPHSWPAAFGHPGLGQRGDPFQASTLGPRLISDLISGGLGAPYDYPRGVVLRSGGHAGGARAVLRCGVTVVG